MPWRRWPVGLSLIVWSDGSARSWLTRKRTVFFWEVRSGARQCRAAAWLLFSDRGRDSAAWQRACCSRIAGATVSRGMVMWTPVALFTTMLECSTASPAEGVDNLCCRTCWAECCMCMSLSPLVVVLVAGLSELAVVELGALHGYACCDVRDGAWGDAEGCACGDAGGGACGDAEGGARGDAEGGA